MRSLIIFLLLGFVGARVSQIAESPVAALARDDDVSGIYQPTRINPMCPEDSIAIDQGQTDPLPSGIPTYTLQIMNVCITGCLVSDIHLSCGWFSSAREINPRLFRRIEYDDCLVNNGEPLAPGQSLSIQYANTFSYPISVSSFTCN